MSSIEIQPSRFSCGYSDQQLARIILGTSMLFKVILLVASSNAMLRWIEEQINSAFAAVGDTTVQDDKYWRDQISGDFAVKTSTDIIKQPIQIQGMIVAKYPTDVCNYLYRRVRRRDNPDIPLYLRATATTPGDHDNEFDFNCREDSAIERLDHEIQYGLRWRMQCPTGYVAEIQSHGFGTSSTWREVIGDIGYTMRRPNDDDGECVPRTNILHETRSHSKHQRTATRLITEQPAQTFRNGRVVLFLASPGSG